MTLDPRPCDSFHVTESRGPGNEANSNPEAATHLFLPVPLQWWQNTLSMSTWAW